MKRFRLLKVLIIFVIVMCGITIGIKIIHYNLWDFLKDNTYSTVEYSIDLDTDLDSLKGNGIYQLFDGVNKDGKIHITGEYDSVNKSTHLLCSETGLSSSSKLDMIISGDKVYIHKGIINRLVYSKYTNAIVDTIIGKDIEYVMLSKENVEKADELIKQLGNQKADIVSMYELLISINNNLKDMYSGINTILARITGTKSCSKKDGVYKVVYTDKNFKDTINGISSFTDKLYNILLKPLRKIDDSKFFLDNTENVIRALDSIYDKLEGCNIECSGYKEKSDNTINCDISLSSSDSYIDINIKYKETGKKIEEIKNYLSIDNILENIGSVYSLN